MTVEDPQIVRAKLRFQELCGHELPRTRLHKRLEDELANGIVLIQAPAGTGKSTLVAQWACSTNRVIAAVRLDPWDSDPMRFWAHVVAACREGFGLECDEARAVLRGGAPDLARIVVSALLNDLDVAGPSAALILEDVHLVADAEVWNSVWTFARYLPKGMGLVLTGRAEPQGPIVRMRTEGRLGDIREPDLRFTLEETRQFLNSLGLEPGEAAISRVHAAFDGWALPMRGIALAAMGGRPVEDVLRPQGALMHDLNEYLLWEVLRAHPEPVQEFLIQTSVLSELDPALCDCVTQRSDSSIILDRLMTSGTFIVRDGTTYRVHALFRAMLIKELQATDPGAAVRMRRRAGRWHLERKQLPQAVEQLTLAGDDQTAADAIADMAEELLLAGQASTVLRALGALSPRCMRSDPRLLVIAAQALAVSGKWSELGALIQQGAATLGADQANPPSQRLRGRWLAATALYQTREMGVHHDPDAVVAMANEARALVPLDDWWTRAHLAMAVGMASAYGGAVAQALDVLTDAVAVFRQTSPATARVGPLAMLVRAFRFRGDLDRAVETARELQELLISGSADATPTITTYIAISELDTLSYELDELNDADAHAANILVLARKVGSRTWTLQALHRLARVYRARGQFSDSLRYLAQVESLLNSGDPTRFALVLANEHTLIAAQGGGQRASRHWQRVAGIYDRVPGSPLFAPRYLLWSALLARARYQLLVGNHASARDAAIRVCEETEGRHVPFTIQAGTIRAAALFGMGDKTEAYARFGETLAVAARGGYVRSVLDGTGPTPELLQCLEQWAAHPDNEHGDIEAFARRLLTAVRSSAVAPSAGKGFVPPESYRYSNS